MNAEETAMRLQETTAKCLTSLDAWNKDLKNEEARENLLDAVHELRKVTSRLELDIAMNDRQVTNAKPIPLPEHKSKMERKKQKPLSEILPVADIKENNKKKKVEIENADDENDNADDGADSNPKSSKSAKNDKGENKPKKPRRKKREDKPSDDES